MTRYRHGWSQGWRKSTRGQSGEWYDSSWELQYMAELDRDPMVFRWTRHHGLRIPYRKWWGGSGRYEPDFLVELAGDVKELREVKGEHLLGDPNTARKLRAGEEFCRRRGMTFRVVTKSLVDPDMWAPGTGVELRETPVAARPAFAEDLQSGKGTGCLGAGLVGVIAVIVVVLALLFFA
jgi:hypothetical protein